MASDWRVLPRPLRKRACAGCGLVTIAPSMTPRERLFDDGYALYAHPPADAGRERERLQQYAGWIGDALERSGAVRPPEAVLDVGCGNGSLLLALQERWPAARVAGCDPSRESAAYAASAGLDVWQGSSATLPAGRQVDLVVSVNVLEHTEDPDAFLRQLRGALAPDGTLVVICPDGRVPGVELLIADHLHSFTPEHVRQLVSRAGLATRSIEPAPSILGSFQMAVASTGRAPVTLASETGSLMISLKAAYLQRWASLDGQLVSRLRSRGVSCFGMGETAGLLRAYAPQTWQHVRAITADDVGGSTAFGTLPVVPLGQLPRNEPLLLGVRPQDQPAVAKRLSSRAAEIITWYDLVEVERL
jgi:SAM-dependent methyltransferase